MATEIDQIDLEDGRLLDVRVSGPDGGVPLLFHHGTPGAAVPFRSLESAAIERGLRLVTTSRPGYGGSTRLRGRTIADVVPDTAALLSWLSADTCLVAGWSGGGPHTLACAARLPGVAGALVIAGVAPADAAGLDWMVGMGDENVTEFTAALQGEDTLAAYLEPARAHLSQATLDDIISALSTLLPPVDRAVLTDEFGEDMRDSFHEAMRVSADGWLDDDLAFSKPWGFSLDEISVPTMIWQGSEDLMVPFSHGEWLAAQMPHASAHLLDGEGHLSIGVGAIGEMLDELVSLLPS